MELQRFAAILALCAMISFAASVLSKEADLLAPATSVKIERKGQTLPFASAKEALAAATMGDVVVMGPGAHRGPLEIKTSGITLSGEAGARVNANSETWKSEWTREPEYGPFAYGSPIPFQPVTVLIDQRGMINIKENRGGPGIHAKGVGRSGRTALGAMFTWLPKSKRMVVSFAEDVDPTKHVIEAAPIRTAAIKVSGVDNCVIKNLVITGGEAGVSLSNTKNTTVERCLMYGVDTGVLLAKGATGCKVLSCDITWNADAIGKDCDPPTVPSDVWMAHKGSGAYDTRAVLLDEAGDNNEIAGNYMYDIWDGVEAVNGVNKEDIEEHYKNKVFKGIAEYNRGLKVHHNRIDLAMDDALEPGCELVDNQWYSNVISRAGCAVRFKTISMGPFFFYDNLLLDSGDGLRLYKSMPEVANVYIFNNTVKHTGGVIYHKISEVAWNNPWLMKTMPKGTPGYHIFNNLFICEKAFSANEGDVAPNFKGDYNVYTAPSEARLMAKGIDVHSLFKAAPQFGDTARGDYRLKSGSAGKGAGCDLAKLDLKVKLPEPLAAAVSGKRPDAGLLGLDADKTPHGPISGLWDLAKNQLNLGERELSRYTLPPMRWITAKQCEFIVRDLPKQEELALTCNRSSDKPNYKVTVRDGKGAVLADKTGDSLADKEGFVLNVPLKGAKELRVAVDDKTESRWGVEAGACTVCIDAAKNLALTKGDGGRFIFDYPVSKDIKSFTVEMRSKYENPMLEIARPGGKPEKVAMTSEVETKGVAGVYRILLTFTKGAELKIAGPAEAVVVIDKKQETVPLRPRWGRPLF